MLYRAVLALLLAATLCSVPALACGEGWSDSPTGLTGVSFNVTPLDDGSYRAYWNDIGLKAAWSPDGHTWTQEDAYAPPEPQAGQAWMANPWVFSDGSGGWRMIYEAMDQETGDRQLHSAWSGDGLSFAYEGLVMAGGEDDMVEGEDGRRSVFLSVPDGVRLEDGRLRMFFVASGDNIQSAVSEDNGLTWQRELAPPLEMAVDPSVVALPGGGWRVYFSDWDEGTRAQRIGYADSADGAVFVFQEWIIQAAEGEILADPEAVWAADGGLMLFYSHGASLDTDPAITRLAPPAGHSLELYPVQGPYE